MEGQAFCPAHVTGFFKAEMDDSQSLENTGSLGAGFSIKNGVTTTVSVRQSDTPEYKISTEGFDVGDTRVSEFVIRQFQKLNPDRLLIDVRHEISVPVGYGLGCSGAVALSLAYALDEALQTHLPREEIGRIAHAAEVLCKTGLGDVLASYHGGFEIRIRPGAPGIGRVEKIESSDISAVMVCFAPVSTTDFLRDRLSEINGLGGRMVDTLMETKNQGQFQDMSLEFASYVNVVTPRMKRVVDDLQANGIKCGIALFGETVFSLVPSSVVQEVLDIAARYRDAIIINSEIDQCGARLTR